MGSHAQDMRTWGFNGWGFLGAPWNWVIAASCVALAVTYTRIVSRSLAGDTASRDSNSQYWLLASACVAIWLAAFLLFRAETHFLGDGYQHLSRLAGTDELIRWRDFGERWTHRWLKEALGGDPDASALLSYRIISTIAGGLGLLAVAAYAKLRYDGHWDRLLFLGICSVAGSMLMAFGYVENYSLFSLSIVIFLVGGLLILQKRIKWYVIVPLTLVMPLFHTLGVVFVPAAAYVFMSATGLTARIMNWGTRRVVMLSTGGLIVAASAAAYAMSNSRFVSLAVVPIVAHQFTPSGYTLFSGSHTVDFLNLLLLLQPAIGLFALVLFIPECRKGLLSADVRFLAVATGGALAAAFLLDPKLGMPRDWDLFSFPAMPLAMLLGSLILVSDVRLRFRRLAAGFAILLGAMSLFPRAVVQHVPELGSSLAEAYMDLDRSRSRTGMWVLDMYYLKKGDTLRQQAIERKRNRIYPEQEMASQGKLLLEQNRYREAYAAAAGVIRLAPNASEGWRQLAACYHATQRFDSAIYALEIADGLNPDNYLIQIGLGMSHGALEDFAKAETYFKRAIRMDSTGFEPYMALAHTYRGLGNQSEYERILVKAAAKPDTEAWLVKDLADIYVTRQDWTNAASAYQKALQLGGDSALIGSTVRRHPELMELMATDSSTLPSGSVK
jgi:tetratricopeptide (TPR) repeat protein